MEEQIRTLVVDDDEGVRFFVGETLRRVGHSVMEASTGDEALERLREGAYDLVVLDLKLGGRLDGIRVLEAAKWRWPEAVVVILTAHGSLESAISAIREGVGGLPSQAGRTARTPTVGGGTACETAKAV